MSTESDPSKQPDPNEPILRDHVYDGIQEYDQKLPNWWLFTLWITVVFFLIYWMAYYQLGFARTDAEKLDPIIAQLEAKKEQLIMEQLDDPNLWKMSRDPSFVAQGEEIYKAICLACHGPGLGGNQEGVMYIGHSLIDKEWTYGGTPSEIFTMINNGTPDPLKAVQEGKVAMPAQSAVLSPEKIAKVTAFVLSKHTPPEES